MQGLQWVLGLGFGACGAKVWGFKGLRFRASGSRFESFRVVEPNPEPKRDANPKP